MPQVFYERTIMVIKSYNDLEACAIVNSIKRPAQSVRLVDVLIFSTLAF